MEKKIFITQTDTPSKLCRQKFLIPTGKENHHNHRNVSSLNSPPPPSVYNRFTITFRFPNAEPLTRWNQLPQCRFPPSVTRSVHPNPLPPPQPSQLTILSTESSTTSTNSPTVTPSPSQPPNSNSLLAAWTKTHSRRSSAAFITLTLLLSHQFGNNVFIF